MQSFKSTVAAAALLVISLGLYHISSTSQAPMPSENLMLQIDDGSQPLISTSGGSPSVASRLPELPKLPALQSPAMPSLSLAANSNTNADLAAGLTPPIQQTTTPRIDSGPALLPPTDEFSSGSNQIKTSNQPRSDFASARLDDDQLLEVLEDQFESGGQPSLSSRLSNADLAASDFPAQQIGFTNSSVNAPASNNISSDFQASGPIRNASSEPDFTSGPVTASDLNAAWGQVDRLVEQDQFREALTLLSRFNKVDNLNGPQRQRLQGWLDGLAGKVIYSNEHHFAGRPYTTRAGDTIETLAATWNVPTQLIYNINRDKFGANQSLAPGTELKVVKGPFDAELDLGSDTLTLYLKNLYAGQFPVRIGVSGDIKPGDHTVVAKAERGFTWRDATGTGHRLPAGKPAKWLRTTLDGTNRQPLFARDQRQRQRWPSRMHRTYRQRRQRRVRHSVQNVDR